MFIVIGVFFAPTGLIDKNGDPIHVFAFLCPAHKLKLLKEQSLFEADAVKPSHTNSAVEPARPQPLTA